MKKILIALDYDRSAQKVAEYGYKIARAMNCQVVLLHVAIDAGDDFSLNYSPIMGFGFFSNEDLIEKDRTSEVNRIALQFLDDLRKSLGDPEMEIIVEHGDSAENILLVASGKDIELIVLGSHGEAEFKKHALGNIAAMPLLVIPTL
jgi:nucleotide-binding universal stress UspA family protein